MLLPCTTKHGKVSDCESCNFDYDEHVAQYEAEMEEEDEENGEEREEEQTSEADASVEASQEDRVDDLSMDEGEGESDEGNEVSEDE